MLKEDSLPWTVDPHTLETQGTWDFNGKYTATTMSAHPKIDPVTGEMIAYGYQAKGDLTDDIAVYTMNPKGEVTNEVWLKSPYIGIIHDIAITQKYVIIPVIARTTSLERLKSGEPMWEWNGDLPTMVGVLPRDGERARTCAGSRARRATRCTSSTPPTAAARSRWSCRPRAASAIRRRSAAGPST